MLQAKVPLDLFLHTESSTLCTKMKKIKTDCLD